MIRSLGQRSCNLGSILPTFYAQLLRLKVYADLNGARQREYSKEFERIFWLGITVKLGIILLVKLNGAYWRQRMTTNTIALCAKRLVKSTPGLVLSKR